MIGLYGPQAAALAALQLVALRRWAGGVPVLLADDCSVDREGLCAVARAHRADLWSNARRFGHVSGDLSVFHKGLTWARGRGLRYLVKLSQRFLWTLDGWLTAAVGTLEASGLPLLARRCAGRETWPLRTESVVLDVWAWTRPAALHALTPRPLGRATEHALHDALHDHCGGLYWPWLALPVDRYGPHQGAVWHCSHPPAAYAALARDLGVKWSGGEVYTGGWQTTQEYVLG